jgi:AraC family transcriptional regulator
MAERITISHAGHDVGVLELLPAPAAANVIPVSLAGFHLEDYNVPTAEIPDHELTAHTVTMIRDSPPCFMHWTERGRAQKGRMDPGTLSMRSPQPIGAVRSDGPIRFLALSLSVETMEQALPEPFTKRPVKLASLMAGPSDPVLTHLLYAIEAEVKAGCPAGRLLLEGLANTTAFYMAQRYGMFPPSKPRQYGGLTRDRLARVVEYIEAHLATDLSVAELAGVACLSPYHFGKMFRHSMGESVHRYVTRRRTEAAKTLLRSGILSLLEIAETVGFSDQSHFTTVFKRRLHMTPSAYRRMMLFRLRAARRDGKCTIRIGA